MKVQHDKKRTTAQKVALFKKFFSGRTDVYGTHDPATGRSWQEKSRVTDAVIRAHLKGERPYGVYLLEGDRTPAAVVDFDNNDRTAPLEFVRRMNALGIQAYTEASKCKGWHIWLWFETGGVEAWKARRVIRFVLEEIGCPDVEVFPKQDAINSAKSYGNFTNAPLFFQYLRKDKTVFVDENMDPFPNQWDFLASIRRNPVELLDRTIREHGLLDTVEPLPDRPERHTTSSSATFGLQPCARRMLEEGVKGNQRSACFRLAVQLRKAGLPSDCAMAALRIWAKKNRPSDGKAIITAREIRTQTECAYKAREYRSCGCQDEAVKPFCSDTCSFRGERDT